jgi:peroxin-5
LLALGVSYVNELDHERAIETLRGWVANHPLYAGMIDDNIDANGLEEDDLYGSASPENDAREQQPGGERRMRARTAVEMRDVERLLLRALDYDRTADAAADVYEALGVVYNVIRDYDAAADAFRRAIDVRPTDYQLRNKLGATLANGNRSDEALPSYREALSLKPKYARGWLNMAISHSNLHNYTDSSRCYLQTLSLNPDAKHVWSYLRIALTCDEKWDLLPLAASQNLNAFREHFDFVDN